MSTSAFDLEQELLAKGADLSAMREEWMKTSSEKGWPITAEGWRRFAANSISKDTFQRRKTSPQKNVVDADPMPPSFLDFAKGHPEIDPKGDGSGEWGPGFLIAWKCAVYRREWHAWMQKRKGAKAA